MYAQQIHQYILALVADNSHGLASAKRVGANSHDLTIRIILSERTDGSDIFMDFAFHINEIVRIFDHEKQCKIQTSIR